MKTILSPDLIFFLLVAIFLIVRLRSVLGRRTGNEKRPKNFFMQETTSLGTEKKKIINDKEVEKSKIFNDSLKDEKGILKNATSVEKICYYDKSFTPKKFLEGATNG